MLALPDVRMINAMSRETIVAAQRATMPPLLAARELAEARVNLAPGAITYAGVSQEGRALVQPLVSGTRPDIGLEMQEQRRHAIKDAFHYSLLQLVGSPQMTATEALIREEDKLRLMGPHLGRVQGEFLGPLIEERIFGILIRQSEPFWVNGADGPLPLPPDPLVGRDIRVDYVSPLARAQKTADGKAILRTLESLLPLAQADPSVLDMVDADAAARALAEAWGAPAGLLRDSETVAALRQQRQQMEMLQTMLNAGDQGAGAIEKLARAGATASAQPAPNAGGRANA